MAVRRKLTDEEKARVRQWAVQREKARHPGAHVTITVNDEAGRWRRVFCCDRQSVQRGVQASAWLFLLQAEELFPAVSLR